MRSISRTAKVTNETRAGTVTGARLERPGHVRRQLVAQDRLERRDVDGEAFREVVAERRAEVLVRDGLPDARPAPVPFLEAGGRQLAMERTLSLAERAEQARVRQIVGLEVEPDLDRTASRLMSGLVVEIAVAVVDLHQVRPLRSGTEGAQSRGNERPDRCRQGLEDRAWLHRT